jgi:amidase
MLRADDVGADLAMLDATDQAALVRGGDLTALELVDAAITRVEKVNGELNAVIHPLFDKARAAAADADASDVDAPFSGVPIVLKDLDGSSAGDPLHFGNVALRDAGHVADHDSHLVTKLRAAGCIPVGKTNTPELGLLPTAEPKAYGPTRNPWNTEHSPGGSSGGSAAAVAAGMVPVGHAGDGGGSIRIPASACGLFGLKPSRGRVSMGPDAGEAWAGLVARHVLTRSVRDSAAILDAIAGAMPGDPYSAAPPTRPYVHEVGADPGRLRIGVRTRAPGALAVTDDECVAAAEDAARLLESLGHHVELAAPAALDDLELLMVFSTVLVVSVVADVEEIGRILGRDVTPDDVEALTWAQYEQGRAATAIDYLPRVRPAPHADDGRASRASR